MTARGLGVALVLAGVAASAAAQGVAYRERWAYLHLEARRAEVWEALAGRDAAAHARVAELLRAPARSPFVPVAEALAFLRGQPADPAFVARTALGVFLLPEISDPDAANEACRVTNVGLQLPPGVDAPGALAFDLEVHDAAGAVVWRQHHAVEDTSDVRMATASIAVPAGELPDGAYRIAVRTTIAGAAPRAHDPAVGWTIHVLRGYQKRAEAALQAARERDPALAGADRARLAALAGAVLRAYTGDTFAVVSDAARDLDRLERALGNLAAERPLGDGLDGDIALATPLPEGQFLQCVLRRADGDGVRPLVVVVAGTPAYDATLARPAVPPTRAPGWIAHELATLGRDARAHVAFVESPGLGRDLIAGLKAALPILRALVPDAPREVLLVCEREAATILGLRIAELRAELRGLVLVGGGAMPGPMLQANGSLPVRYGRTLGIGEDAQTRVLDFVAAQQRGGTWKGDVAWLGDERAAWPFGLRTFAAPIAAFARELFPQ